MRDRALLVVDAQFCHALPHREGWEGSRRKGVRRRASEPREVISI
jgi:hypothetical protein